MLNLVEEIGHRGEQRWNYRSLPYRYKPGEVTSIPWEYSKTPGQKINISKIDGLDTMSDYILARHIGQWIAYKRRDNVCWGNGPFERDVRCLLERVGVKDIDAQLVRIKHRDKDDLLCRIFCRAEAEITYITCQKLSYDRVVNLKTYEDVNRAVGVEWHCHHIFPCGTRGKKKNQGKEYPEYMASFWNLVMVPVDTHRKIHKAYDLVDSGLHWRGAFRHEFPDGVDILENIDAESFSYFAYDWLKDGSNKIWLGGCTTDKKECLVVRFSHEGIASLCVNLYSTNPEHWVLDELNKLEACDAKTYAEMGVH